MSKAERDMKRKLRVFQYAQKVGDISKACRHFGISRQSFYDWKHRYERDGEQGLVNYKPCLENPRVRATKQNPQSSTNTGGRSVYQGNSVDGV